MPVSHQNVAEAGIRHTRSRDSTVSDPDTKHSDSKHAMGSCRGYLNRLQCSNFGRWPSQPSVQLRDLVWNSIERITVRVMELGIVYRTSLYHWTVNQPMRKRILILMSMGWVRGDTYDVGSGDMY